MSDIAIARKRPGPPPTGKGTLLGVRLAPRLLAALDASIVREPDPKPSRPEMIRRALVAHLTPPNSDLVGPSEAGANRKPARATVIALRLADSDLVELDAWIATLSPDRPPSRADAITEAIRAMLHVIAENKRG